MSSHKLSLRTARRARLASLALWGALLLAAPSALAEDRPVKPRTFAAAECAEAAIASGRVMLCQSEKAKSATVLRAWTTIKGSDGYSWIVGFTK